MDLTAEQIAATCHCPLGNVQANWPLVLAALNEQGINTLLVQIAAAATFAVESAWQFKPIKEMGGTAYLNRMYDTGPVSVRLGNTPEADGDGAEFAGEGDIQLTGRRNHEIYGKLLGIDLVANPHADMDPTIAARVMALYFKRERVATFADKKCWLSVRIRINGINKKTGLPNGWPEFKGCVGALLKETKA